VLEAVEIIKEMNQSKKRRVSEDTPLDLRQIVGILMW
jgi:hypothetical protein